MSDNRAMIPRQDPPQVVEENGTAKAEHARFLRPVVFCVVIGLAWCAFIAALAFLAVLPCAKRLEADMAFWVFLFASSALTMTTLLLMPKKSRGAWTERQYGWQDWSFMSYFFLMGLGLTWACAFLAFSREYAFFSFPVMAVTGLIMALYVAIALLVAVMTGHWRGAVLVLAVVPCAMALIALRLHLFR
jgi:hypothetical protein